MNKTIIAITMLLTFVSCRNESDELTEVDRNLICKELFITNPIPSVVTEPYITITTRVDLSKLPKGLTGQYCQQNVKFVGLNSGFSTFARDISKEGPSFDMNIYALRNHTTCSYVSSVTALYDSKDKGEFYESEPITFKVEIDEERLAETQPLVEQPTTNQVTLEAKMNIAPEYSNRFDYHIYCDTTQEFDLWRGYRMDQCEMTANGKGHVTYNRLRFGTRYYYMAYIHNSDDLNVMRENCYIGKVLSFDVPPMQAEVITGDAPSEITLEGLKLPFSVKGINVATKSLGVGICYSAVNQEPTPQDAPQVHYTPDGTGMAQCFNLKPNTTYYYRAFAKYTYSSDEDCTIIYGDVKTFTTPSSNQ